jgi:hypothetical protein
MVDWLAYYASELIMAVKSFTTQVHYGVLMIILQNQPNIQNVITAFLIIFYQNGFKKQIWNGTEIILFPCIIEAPLQRC